MVHFFRSAAAVTLTLVATAFAGAQSTITPSPAPSSSPSSSPAPISATENPPENPVVTSRVREAFAAWQRGRIDRTTYSPEAGGTYDDALVKVVEPDLAAIGATQTIAYRTTALLLGDFVYRYEITGASGVVSVLYSLDQRGKTDGIVFTPRIFMRTPTTP